MQDNTLYDCLDYANESLTVDRSSQQAAHVQDAACGFRMRSCNTHSSFWLCLRGIFGKGVILCYCECVRRCAWCPVWPEWDTAEVARHSGCSSSSLCCSPYPTWPQTLSGCASCCCVWYSVLYHLKSKVHISATIASSRKDIHKFAHLKSRGVLWKHGYAGNDKLEIQQSVDDLLWPVCTWAQSVLVEDPACVPAAHRKLIVVHWGIPVVLWDVLIMSRHQRGGRGLRTWENVSEEEKRHFCIYFHLEEREI